MDPRYIYKPEEYNCQMNEVVSSRCKRNERAKRAHSLYCILQCTCQQNRIASYWCVVLLYIPERIDSGGLKQRCLAHGPIVADPRSPYMATFQCVIYFLFTSLVFYWLYLWYTSFLRFQTKTIKNSFAVQQFLIYNPETSMGSVAAV